MLNTDTDIYMRTIYRDAFALAEKAALDLDGTLTLARRLTDTVIDSARSGIEAQNRSTGSDLAAAAD
jgi:hypothetical protein